MHVIVDAIVWILPAYFANGAPVLTVHVIRRAGYRPHPLDFGATFTDGRRVLGDNKSIEGFLGGVAAGTAGGALLQLFGLHDLLSAFVMSIGALTGDLVGAFVKRRLGLRPGDPAPLLDQLDFVAGSVLAYWLYKPPPLEYVVVVVVLTPLIHLVTNAVAYVLGIKDRPW
ncbi:CDP-2,3-bis-(O-geranylgeranyl)-sn-glycerol synthase [Infirmifilum sp. NZ]|uniref:CDP-2,3-bis-(O-geranylgeranyl)-sn-glycerol synthase n=1 Tax=Infirmifilum sp. NZ TaxID=2926850 RepID=UPI00279AFF91|nr:CDP-2,3-bis-(O-geranylgeranyl)-sn-glycerol synthase [Infirmifilum sp. NZ]UNQ72488.1 CDP-2,3-bis-(O-geranylgeranyl)-sn-glycerol synthase [Infirmifilum sp. NZ]